jgi:hypothetical protein
MLAIFHVNDDTPATRDMALRATDEFKGRIFMRHVLLAATAFATTLISVPAFAQTVTFWQFSTNPNDIAAWEGIIEAFEASHEGIDVVMEIVPWSEQQQRLVTALTTGGLPDVSMLGNNVVAQFQAITIWVASGGPRPSQWKPAPFTIARICSSRPDWIPTHPPKPGRSCAPRPRP